MSRVTRIEPEDETLRRVIQLNGLGLDTKSALRSRLAEIMSQRSDPAATNMLLGVPFYPVNVLLGGNTLPEMIKPNQPPAETSPTERRKPARESAYGKEKARCHC